MTIAQIFAMNDNLDFMVFAAGSTGGTTVEIAKNGRVAIYSQNYPFDDPSFILSRDDSKLLRLIADWLESYDEEEAWEEPQIEERTSEIKSFEAEDGPVSIADGPIPAINQPAEQQQLLA